MNIAALRRALLQAEPELPYIATVPGRGYRFVTPVRLESATPVAEAFAPMPSIGNGPPCPCPIIGRDDDIAEIAALLASNRFLTIVGPAGVGKTTVTMAAARQLAGQYPDGICFVDLAAIGDPRLVTAAVASGDRLGRQPERRDGRHRRRAARPAPAADLRQLRARPGRVLDRGGTHPGNGPRDRDPRHKPRGPSEHERKRSIACSRCPARRRAMPSTARMPWLSRRSRSS